MLAGINMARMLEGKEMLDFKNITSIGALANYISSPNANFQPMNVTHALFEPITVKHKKKERKGLFASRSLEFIDEMVKEL